LGPMAYLDPKGDGNRSLPGNQRPCPGVGSGALRDPCVIWRKLDCLNPNLRRRKCTPTGKTPAPVPHPASTWLRRRCNLRGAERFPVREFKEMNGAPKSRETRTTGTNVGSPKGASLRRRRPRSSRGSHAPPRRTGKPSAGRRGPGDKGHSGLREVRGMRRAETVPDALRGYNIME